MAQGNFLQSLFNRGQQQDVYNLPPLQAPAPKLQDIMINQQGQQMSPEQIAAFYAPVQNQQQAQTQSLGSNITSALFGQQSPQREVPTQVDTNSGTINAGLAQNPRTDGLLQDIASGFRENASTPFAVSNLEPQQNKGFATRLGEGLGSVARFADSPLGRMALTAGIVGATGGSGLQALTYGATAGVGNQALKTQDQFYRNQLQAEGVDTSNIQGYITPEMYKNQSLGQYRSGMLDLGGKRLSLTDYNNVVKNLTKMHETNQIDDNEFKTRLALVNKKFENDNIAGLLDVGKVGKSNQTRNADINQYLAPARKRYYEAMPGLAQQRIGIQEAQLGLEAPYKQAQTMKLMEELGAGGVPLKERTQMQRGVQAVESQVDRFTNTFKGLPTKAESYTAGQARRLTGMQTPAEANFNSQRTLLFNKIARELGGEKGVLSDQDIQRINEALPTLTDSYQQKQAKMQAVYDLIGDVKNRYGMTENIQPFTPNANLTPIPRNAISGGNVKPRQTSKPKGKSKDPLGLGI